MCIAPAISDDFRHNALQDDSSTPLTSDGNEARIVDAVLDMVAAELSSISEGDLVYPVATGSDADSIAFLAAYRGRRKSLWAKASWVLETYRKVLQSSKQMADD